MTAPSLVFRNVEVDGRLTDVRIAGGRVEAVGASVAPRRGDEVVDRSGAAVVPGLWDHHLHLFAMAAARSSVRLGPPEVVDRAGFERALFTSRPTSVGHGGGHGDGWVRAVGYHESVAGDLSRDDLDSVVPDRPVRVQHRSGALWVLNTAALRLTGIESEDGRLFGADELLRSRLSGSEPPSLAAVGEELSSYGVVGVTDATPSTDRAQAEALGRARSSGTLRQSVVVTGGLGTLAGGDVPGVTWGPVKLVLPDHAISDVDELASAVRRAHEAGRRVAVHCVTEAALALALAAWDIAGTRAGDRVEHGFEMSRAAVGRIRELGVTVVTQPDFVRTRGDACLAPGAEARHHDLYRCASLLAEGVAVGGSTDAPFGDPDPWRAMRTAVERRTASGAVLGRGERIAARTALELFLGAHDDPGGRPRRVAVGALADLCLLDASLPVVLGDPDSSHVAATIIAGEIAHDRLR